MCCLFQIATHEKKAHDNWVRFVFPFLYFVCGPPQLIWILFSPTAQGSCCRKSYRWGEEGSCQPETQVWDTELRFQCVLGLLQAVLLVIAWGSFVFHMWVHFPSASRLLELTQKMAVLQEEPVIVKPRPGRPSAQNPPWRGSSTLKGQHSRLWSKCTEITFYFCVS